MNKNEFRYIKKSDTIEGYKWYHEMIDFFKQEIKVMLDMVREDDRKNTPRA